MYLEICCFVDESEVICYMHICIAVLFANAYHIHTCWVPNKHIKDMVFFKQCIMARLVTLII